MKIDGDLVQELRNQLEFELGTKASKIKVSVVSGIATLQGSVPSYADKVTAINAIKRVADVLAWADELVVELPGSSRRTDAEITKAANDAINWITNIPAKAISIVVQGGWLWLEGLVDSCFQREAAQVVVSHLTGVKGVTNLIAIKATNLHPNAAGAINAAMDRHALLNAKKIKAEVTGTKVVLHGNIPNTTSKDEAERVAWTAKGVTAVDNRIAVGAHHA